MARWLYDYEQGSSAHESGSLANRSCRRWQRPWEHIMNRRTFLAAGLGSSLARDVSRKLRIGVLGAVHAHAEEKIPVLGESPDWDLIGVCEEDDQVRRQYSASGVRILSQADLLSECDAVAVESDVTEHARHGKLVLEAGKHLHLEKPPATDFAGLQNLVDLARTKGLLLQIGYMWRYHPGINRAIQAAQLGWLGDIYMVRGTINNQLPARRRPEWERFQGGIMFELGSHLIDAVVRLMGAPRAVRPFLQTHDASRDGLADNTLAVLQYDRGLAVISASALQPNSRNHRSFEILGTRGTASVRPLEPPELVVDLERAAGPYPAGVTRVELPPYRRYVDDLADFARAIRNGSSLPVSLEQELTVQRTLLRCTGKEP